MSKQKGYYHSQLTDCENECCMYYAFSNSADIIGVPKQETPCLTTFIYTKDTGVPLNFMKKSLSWKNNKNSQKIVTKLDGN